MPGSPEEEVLAQSRGMLGNHWGGFSPPKTGNTLKDFIVQALMQAPMGIGAKGAMGGPLTGGTAPGKGFPGHYQYKGMPLEGSAENLAQMHGSIVDAKNPSPMSTGQRITTKSNADNTNFYKSNEQLYNEALVKQMFKEPNPKHEFPSEQEIMRVLQANQPFKEPPSTQEITGMAGMRDAKSPLSDEPISQDMGYTHSQKPTETANYNKAFGIKKTDTMSSADIMDILKNYDKSQWKDIIRKLNLTPLEDK